MPHNKRSKLHVLPAINSGAPECRLLSDGSDFFVVYDGLRIAKRGHWGTPQAKTWVSLEPGWEVREADDVGFFELPGMPRGAVRLRCDTPAGQLATGWVCL